MSQLATSTIEEKYHEAFGQSRQLYEKAVNVFPNGVTHDGRFLQPFPIYVQRAQGSRKWDVQGHEFVDFWVGHGALLLGHGRPEVVEAVQKQAAVATHPGACHEWEILWGQWVKRLIRSAEMVRFTASGTEATLMALRLARIFTGRRKIVKFIGHFHGWHDFLIPAAEPPFDSFEVPGVASGVMQDLVIIPPGDLEMVAQTLDEHEPAGVILEATGSHFGAVPIRGEFLRGLRQLTAERGVLLIFDEVISGFRVHPGGAQGHYEVTPDITVLAKVLAGGLPGGCVAGRRDVLEHLEFGHPSGQKMKHPGTFNANPLSAVAGSTTLRIVADGEPNRKANEAAAQLRRRLNQLFDDVGVSWVAYGEFSAVKVLPDYEGPRPTSDDFIPYGGDYRKLEVKLDPELTRAFRCALLLGGVDMPGFSGMTCCEHTQDDVDRTLSAFAQAIEMLRRDGLID